jgi:hypothetical protein
MAFEGQARHWLYEAATGMALTCGYAGIFASAGREPSFTTSWFLPPNVHV